MLKTPLFQKILSFTSYVAIAILLAWLISDRYPPTLNVGDDAPIKESFTKISGGAGTFKSLLKKPMLVNFWATWCSACMKEMPILSKLSQKYRYQLVFLGVAVQSKPADILSVKRSYFLDYDQVVVNDQALDLWHARALPTTYILDTKGQILWAHAGTVSESELEEALALALK